MSIHNICAWQGMAFCKETETERARTAVLQCCSMNLTASQRGQLLEWRSHQFEKDLIRHFKVTILKHWSNMLSWIWGMCSVQRVWKPVSVLFLPQSSGWLCPLMTISNCHQLDLLALYSSLEDTRFLQLPIRCHQVYECKTYADPERKVFLAVASAGILPVLAEPLRPWQLYQVPWRTWVMQSSLEVLATIQDADNVLANVILMVLWQQHFEDDMAWTNWTVLNKAVMIMLIEHHYLSGKHGWIHTYQKLP